MSVEFIKKTGYFPTTSIMSVKAKTLIFFFKEQAIVKNVDFTLFPNLQRSLE